MAKTRTTNVNINYTVNDAAIAKSNVLLGKASKSTDELRKNLDRTKTSSKGAGDALKKAGDDGSKSMFNLSNIIKGLSIVALAGQFLSFAKQVIAIRGEFQKFEAVLTNTLGSKSAALIALGRINEFAKTTPFSVRELTESFIKLANRGIQPTIAQMRAIGDLSATLGKDFNQVVEAILDINNPERWKEIGVKAETVGDKVKLSFRGITQEVDRTVQGVTDAVVALGQMNGVMGSTAAISATLVGQTSNLGDAWTQLFNTIGQGTEGILFNAVSLLAEAIEKANELLKGQGQRFQELSSKTLGAEIESFEHWVKVLGDVDKAEEIFKKKRESRMAVIADRQRELFDAEDFGPQDTRTRDREKELEHLMHLYEIYDRDLPKAIGETITKIREKATADKDAAAAALAATAAAAAEERRLILEMQARQNAQKGRVGAGLKLPTSGIEGAAFIEAAIHRKMEEDKTQATKENAEARQFIEDQAVVLSQERANQKIEIEQALLEGTLRSLEMILMAGFDNNALEMAALNDKYDKQVMAAGDNERAKMELQIQFERQKDVLDKKKSQQDKKKALIAIAMDTAMNAVKLFAQTVPPGILSAIAVAFGAIQAGIVSQQRFKEGVIDLKGPGTGTSDSISARLSRGESVMTAAETDSSGGIFRLVRARKLNDRLLKELVSGRSGGSNGQRFDDSKIVKELQDLKYAFPDVKMQSGIMYETREKAKNYKQWIRSSSMGI